MEGFEKAHQPTQVSAREKAKTQFFEMLQKGRERVEERKNNYQMNYDLN